MKTHLARRHASTACAAAFATALFLSATELLAQCEVQELTAEAVAQCKVHRLTEPHAVPGNSFGRSISADGNVAVVGAPSDEWPGGTGPGAAYVYRLNGSTWALEQRLVAETTGPNRFGRQVAVSGDVIVVAAPGDAKAYVYRYDGATWAAEQTLSSLEAGHRELYGQSVAVSGDVVLVGAFRYPCTIQCLYWGITFVYRFNGSIWVEEQKLMPFGDPVANFGFSVAADDDVALVGGPWGPGTAYLFRFDGTSWVQEARIDPVGGLNPRGFGYAVSLRHGLAAVGSPEEFCAQGGNCGAAHVFRLRSDGPRSWASEQRLVAPDAAASDGFGRAISIGDGRIVVGAGGDDCEALPDSNCGAAYLFRFDVDGAEEWTVEQKVVQGGLGDLAWFGSSVELDGTNLLVGAYGDMCEGSYFCGSAHAYILGPDCNENGQADLCDIRDAGAPDWNANGVPDQCEPLVALDIKPGECPNTLNARSHGLLKAALIGSKTADVGQIDRGSLALRRADGVGGSVRPLVGPPGPGFTIDDVTAIVDGAPCECHDLPPDGIDDLTMRFSMAELVETLELSEFDAGEPVMLTLSGALVDGTQFTVSDCIVVTGRPPGGGPRSGGGPHPYTLQGDAGKANNR